MLYLIVQITTNPEFFEDLKYDQINPWSKYNLMVLDKTIIKILNI